MKHAILIMTHNNEEITSRFISLYDDSNIDFYIHVDKKALDFKYGLLENICKKSRVFFIPQKKVFWGTYSQIQCEISLLNSAIKNQYDYYHLISGCDIPVLSKKQFINFFENNLGKEFVEFSPKEIAEENKVIDRVKYYYFFMNSIRSRNTFIRKPQTYIREQILGLQKYFRFSRLKNVDFRYGSNWFDITHDFASYVLDNQKWIYKYFHHSCCGDELFLQTLLYNSVYFKNNYYNDNNADISLGRYVDWSRGEPYTFKEIDFNELIMIKNAFFIRKFDYELDRSIVEKLFNRLEEKNKNEI